MLKNELLVFLPYLSKKNFNNYRILSYTFSFVSLFPPLHTFLLKYHYHTLLNENTLVNKGLAKDPKIRYRYSYLLMTLLKYLKFTSPIKKGPKLRFACLPIK